MPDVRVHVAHEVALRRVRELQSTVAELEGGLAGSPASAARRRLLSLVRALQEALDGGVVTLRPPTVLESPLVLRLHGGGVADDQVVPVVLSEARRLRLLLEGVEAALRSPLPPPPPDERWTVLIPDTNVLVRTLPFDDVRWLPVAEPPLLVVLPQLLYDELDARKYDRNATDARHAREAVKRLERWLGDLAGAKTVQPGLWLTLLVEELDHQRLPVADNEIASIGARLRELGERVVFLSNDGGARTRAQGLEQPHRPTPWSAARRTPSSGARRLARIKSARAQLRVRPRGGAPACQPTPAGARHSTNRGRARRRAIAACSCPGGCQLGCGPLGGPKPWAVPASGRRVGREEPPRRHAQRLRVTPQAGGAQRRPSRSAGGARDRDAARRPPRTSVLHEQ